MTRSVIGADVAIRLAHDGAVTHDEHEMPAPTLPSAQPPGRRPQLRVVVGSGGRLPVARV